jgi:hypothetical protein
MSFAYNSHSSGGNEFEGTKLLPATAEVGIGSSFP